MQPEIRPFRLLLKALILFVVFNVLFAVINPAISQVTLYNSMFPGRVRFPFGDQARVYSVMVDDLDIMAASHEISRPKAADEFRVVLIGDSSVWSEGAQPDESISVLWNDSGVACGNKRLKFYNLGYPHPSAIKDLLILDKAMEYEPDMIVWFMTLNTLTPRRLSPFVHANSDRAVKVLDAHNIPYDVEDVTPENRLDGFYQRTIIGRSSEIARLLKLQALGLFWSIEGIDRTPGTVVVDRSNDVSSDTDFKGYENEAVLGRKIMRNALHAGYQIVSPVPVMIVNEPMFIATGLNSDLRYNDGYPRWAYDYYRNWMLNETQQNDWDYLDLWNSVPSEYFIDGAFHMSPDGQRLMIQKINPALQSIACP